MTSKWYPHVTVAAICEKDGEFLMVEEHSTTNSHTVLNQPAGHVEKDESIVDAVVRETLEETCWQFTPESLIGLYRWVTPHGKTYLRYTFCGTALGFDQASTRDPEIVDSHWMSINEIRNSSNLRSPLVISCLDDYLNGIRYPLELIRDIN